MAIKDLSRRDFIISTAAYGIGAAALSVPAVASARKETKLRVLAVGVVGTIGGADRDIVNKHPGAEVVGLCDVDANALAKAAQAHPDAFTCADYREAFDKHGDKFDAVIVATPDHSHCAIMTLALAKHKHVYGQKPLVQQLQEVELLDRAARKRSRMATQTANQRIESKHRRAAVDILRSGVLGKVIEVHVTYGNGSLAGGHYFCDGVLGDPIEPPAHIDYDLWLNGAAHEPCRPQMVERRWRSWWNYGTGEIGDWVVHLTDVLYYAFPELESPVRVCTRTPSHDLTWFHAVNVLSTLTYEVDSDSFANTTCNFYFYDGSLKIARKHLGIGDEGWLGGRRLAVVCEGGTLVLGPSEPLEIWREGQKTDGLEMPGLPTYEKFNHWHAWVDKALGKDSPNHWTPFDIGLRGTEAGLLAVKAAMYPGQVLDWDRKRLKFTNHAEATRTIVERDYRKGFKPVRV